jgi:hypothetical protein
MLKEVDELRGQGDERFIDILLPTAIIISFLLAPSHLLLFSDFPIPNSDFRFLSSDFCSLSSFFRLPHSDFRIQNGLSSDICLRGAGCGNSDLLSTQPFLIDRAQRNHH